MSRSYKKYPHWTDNTRGGAKWAKRKANKKVRKIFDISNGCIYKRYYDTWNIHDYSFVEFRPRHLAIRQKHYSKNFGIGSYITTIYVQIFEADKDWYNAISK